MPDSGRDRHAAIVAFAVTVCLLIVGMIGWYQGFQIGQESHQSQSAKAYQKYSSEEIAERCALVFDLTAKTECISDAVRDAREQQRAEQDLDAQQQMSYWAKWMLIATVVMAAITFFGVVFVWQTLEATREMAMDNKMMAQDTRDIGEAQVRAYPRIEEFDFATNGNHPGVGAKVVNSGQSPIKDAEIVYKCKVIRADGNARLEWFGTIGLPEIGAHESHSVGLHTNLSFDAIREIQRDWRDFPKNLQSVEIIAAVYGFDVFGEEVMSIANWMNVFDSTDEDVMPGINILPLTRHFSQLTEYRLLEYAGDLDAYRLKKRQRDKD